MKSKKTFHLIAMAVICSLLVIPKTSFAGKKKADFTGEWALNESKSDLGEGRFFSAVKMNVAQDGKTITIDRTRTGRNGEERTTQETLTLDGKENTAEAENRSTTSTASWSDDKTSLTIKSAIEFNRQGETFEMNRTETWTLAEDGMMLTIQSDSSSARGDRSVTLIYDKK